MTWVMMLHSLGYAQNYWSASRSIALDDEVDLRISFSPGPLPSSLTPDRSRVSGNNVWQISMGEIQGNRLIQSGREVYRLNAIRVYIHGTLVSSFSQSEPWNSTFKDQIRSVPIVFSPAYFVSPAFSKPLRSIQLKIEAEVEGYLSGASEIHQIVHALDIDNKVAMYGTTHNYFGQPSPTFEQACLSFFMEVR